MAIIGISAIHLLKIFIEAGSLGGLPLCSAPEGLAAVETMLNLGPMAEACSPVKPAH